MTKVTPKPKTNFSTTMYDDLDYGDCFLMNNGLWMKDDAEDEDSENAQSAVSLTTGKIETELCGTQVIPVDVEIKWKKKK